MLAFPRRKCRNFFKVNFFLADKSDAFWLNCKVLGACWFWWSVLPNQQHTLLLKKTPSLADSLEVLLDQALLRNSNLVLQVHEYSYLYNIFHLHILSWRRTHSQPVLFLQGPKKSTTIWSSYYYKSSHLIWEKGPPWRQMPIHQIPSPPLKINMCVPSAE